MPAKLATGLLARLLVANGAGPRPHVSDTGGYAHLIGACAQWLYVLEGKRDWEQQHLSPLPSGQ
ncbi:MAG TPA: hypothetical protein VGM54_25230 [Chthoniobacter sp.]